MIIDDNAFGDDKPTKAPSDNDTLRLQIAHSARTEQRSGMLDVAFVNRCHLAANAGHDITITATEAELVTRMVAALELAERTFKHTVNPDFPASANAKAMAAIRTVRDDAAKAGT